MLNQKSKIFFALALATVLAFLLVLGFTMTIRTNEEENAFAEEIAPTPRVLTDGQYKGEEITLFQGESATFTVSFGEETFLPVLSINEIGGAFLINENKLTVCENSKVGKTKIDVFCILNEDEEFLQTITVEVKYNGTINDIFTTDIDRIMTVTLPEKVEYVDAMVAAQDHSTGINVRLKDGDVVNEIVEGVPHGISGLTFTYTEIGFASIDSTGNSSTQALNGEESGAELVSYSTNSLSGSGTEGSPYGIYDVSDFMSISDYDGTGKYFKQYSNFSITSSFTVKDFYGNYNGNSKTITASNFSNQYAVLFKTNYGWIFDINVVVENISITTLGYAGVVCRQNEGEIEGVNVSGQNSCTAEALSLEMMIKKIQTGSFDFIVDITYRSASLAGGISGYNSGTIENCETNIRAESSMTFGGIVEYNATTGNVINCIAHTAVKNITASILSCFGGIIAKNDGVMTMSFASNLNKKVVFFTLFSDYVYDNSTVIYIGGVIGYNNNSSVPQTAPSNYSISALNSTPQTSGALPTNVQSTYVKEYIGKNTATY